MYPMSLRLQIRAKRTRHRQRKEVAEEPPPRISFVCLFQENVFCRKGTCLAVCLAEIRCSLRTSFKVLNHFNIRDICLTMIL